MRRTGTTWAAFASVCAIIAAGCASEQRVTGGTSETENAVFALDSVLPDWNRPAARATIATLRLDSNSIDFAHTDSLGRDIAVERLDGSPLPFAIVYWDKAASLARLQVRIDTSLAAKGSMIRVRWSQTLAQRSVPETVWAGIPDSQKMAVNSFVVDDFEHDDIRSLLPGRNLWESNAYDSLKIISVSTVKHPGRPGRVLHMACSTQAGAKIANTGYGLVQVSLGDIPRNLRSMDSIVFWTKGPGTIAVAFNKNEPTLGQKAWKHVEVDSNWTRVVVTPSTFEAGNGIGGNIGWGAVRDSITDLAFFISKTTDLWLDDIRIHGIDRGDLE